MAKYVRMRLQLEAETSAGRSFDHPGKARCRERRSALADEDEGRRHALALQAPQGPQLVANQGMRGSGGQLCRSLRVPMRAGQAMHSRFKLALIHLGRRKGPEPRLSLGLLVWQLCDLCAEEAVPV